MVIFHSYVSLPGGMFNHLSQHGYPTGWKSQGTWFISCSLATITGQHFDSPGLVLVEPFSGSYYYQSLTFQLPLRRGTRVVLPFDPMVLSFLRWHVIYVLMYCNIYIYIYNDICNCIYHIGICSHKYMFLIFSLSHIYICIYICIYIYTRQMPGLCPEPQPQQATHHHQLS